jgi:DnaD/phage-associated family protein
MEFKFDLGLFGGVFAVPNSIADEHIKIATAAHLKVLLYCLRHAGTALSAGEISRATGVAPDDVTTSLEFWRQRVAASGLPENPTFSESVAESEKKAEIKKANALLSADYEFSPKEISDVIRDDPNAKYLFERAEDLYGRPLRHNENKALTVILQEVGIKPEVALMLLEYCFTVEKTTPNYIKTVAKDWFKQGIDSFEKADTHIKQLMETKEEKAAKKSRAKTQDSATPSSFDLDELDKQIMEEYKGLK